MILLLCTLILSYYTDGIIRVLFIKYTYYLYINLSYIEIYILKFPLIHYIHDIFN